ncbi:rhomboid family intramembrane serine protease [Crocinitomicaceae bacterium]|jgi:membrane associated rhomboid family serine protease|nr:rhomboid family intramembrane serine protease [Flavobacteriales bacterium]MDA7761698.1 rhomboid family intramembrane serine protease [Crocinitomicaceae bacterium]MDB4340157.1 rhomboid family intramembrane serine protease [Crocinitomicaceae bacterium]MDC0459121.1 rhomboid family intramembrane serine protease [Crocinitomicaceae bacterium]MDO7614515.1 rhomboid family intramembrane serine protease [Crocinitomicaceae bacterium]
MLNNLPQVTKNILILNIMFFVASFFLETQGINLIQNFGAHYVNSPFFEPYQVVTHFFMHADFFHILFNMWIFVILGAHLEKIWGPKRFFIFYLISAFTAFALFNIIGVYEIEMLKAELIDANYSIDQLNVLAQDGSYVNKSLPRDYFIKIFTPMVGASGAIFGVMAAFTILFPNTTFYLYFAIPVKAKFLVGAYLVYTVYMILYPSELDNTAHLAHLGGAIAGGIMVLYWRRQDRSNFW